MSEPVTDLLFDGRSFSAFLFDMDGTLLSSIASAERVWTRWAARHGVEASRFLPTMHGVRAVDTIAGLEIPGVDPEAEAARLTLMEMEDLGGIEPIGGIAAFLASLPAHRWAIVTSAPRPLALRRLGAIGLAPPAVLVAAEDVDAGKPNPDPYLLAAGKLGVKAGDCLVFEDAEAGIRAGEAAGADVLVITATHRDTREFNFPAVRDYRELAVLPAGPGRFQLRRTSAGRA